MLSKTLGKLASETMQTGIRHTLPFDHTCNAVSGPENAPIIFFAVQTTLFGYPSQNNSDPRDPISTCWLRTVKGFQGKGNRRRVFNVHRCVPTRRAILNGAGAPARQHLQPRRQVQRSPVQSRRRSCIIPGIYDVYSAALKILDVSRGDGRTTGTGNRGDLAVGIHDRLARCATRGRYLGVTTSGGAVEG